MKQQALTDAIRSEQRMEEINGFHKTKLPGNSQLITLYLVSNLHLQNSHRMMMKILGPSQKITSMTKIQCVLGFV